MRMDCVFSYLVSKMNWVEVGLKLVYFDGKFTIRMVAILVLHVWDQLFTVDTIWNIGETGDIYTVGGSNTIPIQNPNFLTFGFWMANSVLEWSVPVHRQCMSLVCHFSDKVYKIDLIMKLSCWVNQILKDELTCKQRVNLNCLTSKNACNKVFPLEKIKKDYLGYLSTALRSGWRVMRSQLKNKRGKFIFPPSIWTMVPCNQKPVCYQ